MRIAVCDDELVCTQLICEHLNTILRLQAVEASILPYTDPRRMVDAHKVQPFDAIFLDIEMPLFSGFDAAQEIRSISEGTYIIFVTAKHELVYESFEYTPFYFLCKVSEDDLRRDLNHVMRKLMVNFRQNQKLTIQDSTFGTSIIPLKDILYIVSDKHYLLYHTRAFSVPYKERGTIAAKEIEFFSYQFLKPHRRYLVNMNCIEHFDNPINSITLMNGEIIPISKGMKDEAFRMYKEFKRR